MEHETVKLDLDYNTIVEEKQTEDQVDKPQSSSASDSNYHSLIARVQNFFVSNLNDRQDSPDGEGALPYSQRISLYLQNKFEVETSYTKFIVFFSIGFILFFISLCILPFSLVAPSKFVFIYSIGSCLILYSFIYVYGVKSFVIKIFSNERFYYSILYTASLMLGIIVSCFTDFYLISFVCVIAQLVLLIIFVLTFMPGGESAIKLIRELLFYPISILKAKLSSLKN